LSGFILFIAMIGAITLTTENNVNNNLLRQYIPAQIQQSFDKAIKLVK